MAHIESGWPEPPEAGPEPPAEQQATGAMRSWLVRGTRKFTVDRRRRFGLHGQSRRLLAAGSADRIGTRGSWQEVVAALQRQAVHSALAQLRKTDRQILTLAYLQGRTNREIAAMLGVSVSTVRRRITAALARLDEYVRQARIWVTSLAVIGLAHAHRGRWPGIVSIAAAATTAVVGLGVVAVGPDNFLEPRQPTRPPAITTIGDAPAAPVIVLRANPQPAAGVQPLLTVKSGGKGTAQTKQGDSDGSSEEGVGVTGQSGERKSAELRDRHAQKPRPGHDAGEQG